MWGNAFSGNLRESGADTRPGSTVWGLFEGNILGVVDRDRSYQLQADRIILATGSVDLPFSFSGGSLPGVFTLGAINVMLHKWLIMPWKRFVFIGDADNTESIQQEIEYLGGEIVAHVSGLEGGQIRAYGEQGVEAVEIDGTIIEANAVVINVGRQPDIELALMAECDVGYCDELGGFVPVRNELLQTSNPEILIAGDAAGLCVDFDSARLGSVQAAMTEGWYAGISAARSLDLGDEELFQTVRSNYFRDNQMRHDLLSRVTPLYAQV